MSCKNMLKLSKKITDKTYFTTLVIPKKDKIYSFFDYQKFKTRYWFGVSILNGIITLDNAVDNQINPKYGVKNFKKSTKPRILEKRTKKNLLLKMGKSILQENKGLLMFLKVKYFQ